MVPAAVESLAREARTKGKNTTRIVYSGVLTRTRRDEGAGGVLVGMYANLEGAGARNYSAGAKKYYPRAHKLAL